ncbi:MAG: DinB family protein, partial [Thermoanaerobaculia bacterium]
MNSRLIEFAEHYWAEYLGKIERAVAPLSEEQLWWRGADPNAGGNSIANLLAHLHGNLSQWVLTGLGGQPFERHRDEEFAARGAAGAPAKTELLGTLAATVARCRETIRELSE